MQPAAKLPLFDVPGFPCPNCADFRIKASLQQLLYSPTLVCGGCGFELKIDRSGSKKMLTLLQDLYIAEKNVESVSKKFSR